MHGGGSQHAKIARLPLFSPENFNSAGLTKYWKILIGLQGIYLLLMVIGFALGGDAVSLITGLVSIGLTAWFASSVKNLSELIANGEITRYPIYQPMCFDQAVLTHCSCT